MPAFKWNILATCLLGTTGALANAIEIAPPATPLLIRKQLLERPFRVRILIRELTEAKVEIVGSDLRDEKGKLVDGRRLLCLREGKPGPLPSLLGKLELGDSRWNCSAPNYRRRLEGLLRLTPDQGFVGVNGRFYRGSIDLLPKEDGRIQLINELPMDDYLAGLLNKEMRSDFPSEALKAQAIAARSYALATAADRRRSGSFYDMWGTEADQVYEGTHSEDARAFRMVRETKDLVLTHQEDVLKAWYHSSSGGHSELPANVWGESRDDLAYLARESPVDREIAADWSVVLSPLMGLRWAEVGKLLDFRVLERSKGLRVQKVLVTGIHASREWSGDELRKRLGTRWLKSTLFNVRPLGNGWRLEGRGWGHGVGMSQLGARALAKQGKNYKQILEYYYPYSSIRTLPLDEAPPVMAISGR